MAWQHLHLWSITSVRNYHILGFPQTKTTRLVFYYARIDAKQQVVALSNRLILSSFFSLFYTSKTKYKKNRNILPLRVHYFKFIHHCATEAKKVTRPRDVCEATISSSFFFSQLLSKHTHFLNYLKSTFFLCVCVCIHMREGEMMKGEKHISHRRWFTGNG